MVYANTEFSITPSRFIHLTLVLIATTILFQGCRKKELTNAPVRSIPIVIKPNGDSLPSVNIALRNQLEHIARDQKINADSAYKILSNWNSYPEISKPDSWFLFLYKDPIFGTVPLKIYIPKNYQSIIASPAVLLLHGAAGMSSFKDAYVDTVSSETDVSLFSDYFIMENLIIIKPFADGSFKFDWVINHFGSFSNVTNQTFCTLVSIISQLKEVINIDDNKVFAFGHSDGADGAFALQVYEPSVFAGFVSYNSLLNQIISYDIYLRNTLNRPLYLVHSDLDDIRPIQQNRLIVNLLDSIKSPVLYKEYIGYEHSDKHLEIDLPYSYDWMKGVSRNSFQKNITWETSDLTHNSCDWLKIIEYDTTTSPANWHTKLNTKLYNKIDKVYLNMPHYTLNESAAAQADFNNNVFELKTSRVREIELLISPIMTNLQNPVKVVVNGKEIFNKNVKADKNFLLDNFKKSFDRKALWVASIKAIVL
jgi:predicted esterase